MLRSLLLLAALFLAVSPLAAQESQPVPIESMKINGPYLTPEFNRESRLMVIQVVVYEDVASLNKALTEMAGEELPAVFSGYTLWTNDDVGCQLHVVRAKHYNDEEFQIWGHELGHCMYGAWHGEAPLTP